MAITPTTHVLWLPDFVPTSLNRLQGHWGKRHRIKNQDKQLIQAESLRQGIPTAEGKRKVSLRIVLPKGTRRLDSDNVWKSLLDALVDVKLLKDDSPSWCETTKPEWLRGESTRETFVVLEDVV